MPFLNFTAFCGRRTSDGLFNEQFINHWVKQDLIYSEFSSICIDDEFSMFLMGGEI